MTTRFTFLVRELLYIIGREHTMLPNGRPLEVMKVARYAFDIAALQPIDDPCRTKSATARQSRVAR